MNLGARRQKSQALRPCFGLCQLFFVKCMHAGYLYHHPWSETQQTGYSMGVTVSLRYILSKRRNLRGENHATNAS